MDRVTVTKFNEVFLRVNCEEGILREMSEHFTFMIPNAKYDKRVQRKLWDGKIKLMRPGRLLYLGLVHDVETFCKNNNYEFDNQIPKPAKSYTYAEIEAFAETLNITAGDGSPLKPHDYQIQAVVDILNDGYRGIILSPTSSGKSLIIYILFCFFNQKSIIIVPTKLLVRQMAQDFFEYGYKGNISQLMSDKGVVVDKANLEKVTVSTWQSIYKMPQSWFLQFKVILGDEAHTFKANSLKSIMENSTSAFARIGTSGTLDNETVNMMVLKGLFGRIFKTRTTKQLMDEGKVTPLDITAIRLIYSAEDKKLAATLKRDYPDEMDYLNYHPKRLAFITALTKKLKGNTLVLFKNIEHGKLLHKMISEADPTRDVHLVYGKTATEDRDLVRTLMESGDNVIGVCSYRTFATGTNIKNLHNIIFAAPIKSQILVLQAIGRVLRLHASKSVAKLYDIGDDLTEGKVFKNHAFRHFVIRLNHYVKEQFKHKIVEVNLK